MFRQHACWAIYGKRGNGWFRHVQLPVVLPGQQYGRQPRRRSRLPAGWTSLGTTNGANTASFTPSAITGNISYACFVTPGGSPACGTPTWANGVITVSQLTVTAGDNNSGNPYCASGTIGLTATVTPAGSYTYSWSSNPAGFTSALQNPTLPAQNFQGQSPVFTVSVSDGSCTATASTSESVYPTLVLNAALANCSFIDSAHINVSVDSNLVIVTGSGGVAPYTFSAPAGSAIRDVITTSKHMYTVPSNNALYNYTITDQVGCTATSNNVQSLNGNPTNIPYTVVNGSETLTCYDNAYGKWLTFNDPSNNAVLEIYDSSQNLGQVSVTIYKDKTSMHIQESGYGCGLGSTYESPMQRHFVIHSTAAQPFSNQVKLRLYFSDAELDSIEKAEADDYNGTLCSQLGAVNSLSDLYVTKYDDPRVGTQRKTAFTPITCRVLLVAYTKYMARPALMPLMWWAGCKKTRWASIKYTPAPRPTTYTTFS